MYLQVLSSCEHNEPRKLDWLAAQGCTRMQRDSRRFEAIRKDSSASKGIQRDDVAVVVVVGRSGSRVARVCVWLNWLDMSTGEAWSREMQESA